MTRYGFVEATPGTCERGRAERERQDSMIAAAGGIMAYMGGCTWQDNSTLTARAGRGIIQEAEGHDKAPVTAA